MDETAKTKQKVPILYESNANKDMAAAIQMAIEKLAGKYQIPELIYWCNGRGYDPASLEGKPVIFVGWEEIRHRENPMPDGAKVIIYVHNYGENTRVIVFKPGILPRAFSRTDANDYTSVEDAAEQIAMTTYHYGIYEPAQPIQPEKPAEK